MLFVKGVDKGEGGEDLPHTVGNPECFGSFEIGLFIYRTSYLFSLNNVSPGRRLSSDSCVISL